MMSPDPDEETTTASRRGGSNRGGGGSSRSNNNRGGSRRLSSRQSSGRGETIVPIPPLPVVENATTDDSSDDDNSLLLQQQQQQQQQTNEDVGRGQQQQRESRFLLGRSPFLPPDAIVEGGQQQQQQQQAGPFVWIQEEDMLMLTRAGASGDGGDDAGGGAPPGMVPMFPGGAGLPPPPGPGITTTGRRTTTTNAQQLAAWQEERERRQRTVRVLLMFLLMLLLMDSDENQNVNNMQHRHGGHPGGLRARTSVTSSGKNGKKSSSSYRLKVPLEKSVFEARQRQEHAVQQWSKRQPRYLALIKKNQQQKTKLERERRNEQHNVDEFDRIARTSVLNNAGGGGGADTTMSDHDADEEEEEDESSAVMWHYPWNSTGFYRGEWTTNNVAKTTDHDTTTIQAMPQQHGNNEKEENTVVEQVLLTELENSKFLSAAELEQTFMFQRTLQKRKQDNVNNLVDDEEDDDNQHHPDKNKGGSTTGLDNLLKNGGVGVVLLPPATYITMRDDHNFTTLAYDRQAVDSRGRLYALVDTEKNKKIKTKDKSSKVFSKSKSDAKDGQKQHRHPEVTLTQPRGRLAMQLYSRAIPACQELSLVEGFVKLYDYASRSGGATTSTQSYSYASTNRDMLIRVRGVLLHSVGQLSLVSTAIARSNSTARSALVMMTDSHQQLEDETTATSMQMTPGGEEDDGDRRSRQRRRLLLDGILSGVSSTTTNAATDVERVRDETLAVLEGDEDLTLSNDKTKNKGNGWSLFASSTDTESEQQHEDEDLLQQYPSPYAKQHEADNDSGLPEPKNQELLVEHQDASIGHPSQLARNRILPPQRSDPLSHVQRKTQEAVALPLSRPMRGTQANKKTGNGGSGFGFLGRNEAFASPVDVDNTAAIAFEEEEEELDPSNVSVNSEGEFEDEDEFPPWSDIVLPYPFVRDDKDESIRKTKTPAARRMPPREKKLEDNAAECEFELSLNVQEVEWTVGALKTLLKGRAAQTKRLNPTLEKEENGEKKPGASSNGDDTDTKPDSSKTKLQRKRRGKVVFEHQALVTNIVGSIHSPNCGFSATLNATALRTDWDATTSKAINYSFVRIHHGEQDIVRNDRIAYTHWFFLCFA